MPGLGWTEILVIMAVALVVLGPKDLPVAIRTVTRAIRQVRGMARDMTRSLNDMARDSGMDELGRDLRAMTNPTLDDGVRESIANPFASIRPDTARPNTDRTDTARTDNNRTDNNRTDNNRTDNNRTDNNRTGNGGADSTPAADSAGNRPGATARAPRHTESGSEAGGSGGAVAGSGGTPGENAG